MPLSEPIASLNNTYKTNAGSVTFGISSQMTAVFNKYSPFDTIYLFVVSKSQIYQILSTIQNKILEWSLILEENGIIGEEFSFTENEIEKAKQTPVINNYTNNFYANVDNMDLQQGSSE